MITLRNFVFLASVFIMTSPSWSQVPDSSIVGYATLNGGTTGGEGGEEVIVNSFEDLVYYAEFLSAPYKIYIRDTITGKGSVAGGDYDGSIKIKSNKTIIGLDSTAFLDGVGLTMDGGSNIIIQNIKMSFISIAKSIPEGSQDIPGIYSEFGDEGRAQILVNGGDLISIRGQSKNIWIDHCELYSEDPAAQLNKDLYDGLIDIKNQTGFITISWCYFHDHWKTHLVGSNDDDLYEDRKITFHHNRYENVSSRLPFYRGAVGHVFNNYIYRGLSSCVNPRLGACLRVEKNYFEDSKNTISPTDDGLAERIDNKEVNCTNTGSYPDDCAADLGYIYDHMLTSNVDDVKNIVIQYSGVGKLMKNNTSVFPEYCIHDILIYPNPFRERLYIMSPHYQDIQIEISDMQGRSIHHQNISGSAYIDLSSIDKGVYVMTLKYRKNISVRKIIRE